MTRTASIAALVLLAGCGGSSSPSAATPTHHTPGPLADTWAWDGGAWHQTANTGPAPRYSASLAYDAARGVYIMFGGQTARATSDETWTWDGKTWTRVDRAPEPPGRASSALVWDPVNSSLLVFGGTGLNSTAGPGAQGALLGDFWSLAGSAWKQITAAGPPAQGFTNAIWDSGRKRAIVLLGMPCPQPSGDAWAWDGAAWSKTASGISPRWGAASAQNPDGSALIFGGSDEAGC